ncbi:MAG: ATP-binding cassette domain-containing protein [Dysgonamonadaceae bacterium]|jgi:zinc transport system ATP-binding protein|nr:ATP-binding cassette domain-containing protein [Dysgonamonadaceae bacterium]
MNNHLIEIENLNAGYDDKLVLKDVSLNISRGDFLGIIGPNGGGKTTLLKLILGLLKPKSGEIRYCQPGLKDKIGYMPQTNYIDKQFPILVKETIASGLISEKNLSKRETKAKVEETISQMGLEEIKNKPIGEISGGQLQRTLLARAIINQPELLILDEPNSYVDKRFEMYFYELLQEINKKTSIVLVSHDIGTVISTVKNIACVNETLHYHAGTNVDYHWLEKHFACPFDLIGHGNIPHRILKNHP